MCFVGVGSVIAPPLTREAVFLNSVKSYVMVVAHSYQYVGYATSAFALKLMLVARPPASANDGKLLLNLDTVFNGLTSDGKLLLNLPSLEKYLKPSVNALKVAVALHHLSVLNIFACLPMNVSDAPHDVKNVGA